VSIVLAGMFVATRFGTADFASFSYVNLTGTMIATVCSLGIGMAVMRSFARLNQPDLPGTADVAALTLLLAVTSVLGLLVGFVIGETSAALPRATDRMVLTTVAGLAVASGFLGGALLGLERFRQLALANVASAAGLGAAVGLAAVLESPGTAVASLAIAQTALFVIAAASLRDHSRRVLRDFRSLRVAHLVRAMGVAGPISLVSALVSGTIWAVGQAQVSADDQGLGFAIYAAGLSWFSVCMFLPSIASQVMAPKLFRGMAGESAETHWRQALATTLLTVLLAVPVCSVTFLASDWVTAAYGPSMSELRAPLGWFVAAALIAAPINILGTAIVAGGGQWTWLAITAVWAVAFFGGAYLLQDSASYSAAPKALVIAYVVHLAATVWQSKRRYAASREDG